MIGSLGPRVAQKGVRLWYDTQGPADVGLHARGWARATRRVYDEPRAISRQSRRCDIVTGLEKFILNQQAGHGL